MKLAQKGSERKPGRDQRKPGKVSEHNGKMPAGNERPVLMEPHRKEKAVGEEKKEQLR